MLCPGGGPNAPGPRLARGGIWGALSRGRAEGNAAGDILSERFPRTCERVSRSIVIGAKQIRRVKSTDKKKGYAKGDDTNTCRNDVGDR